MPWKECNQIDERLKFIARLLDGEKMAAVCRDVKVSRKTGYTPSAEEAAIHTDAFRRRLEEMGYVEGRSVAIEYRWARGDYSRLPSFAADLLGRRSRWWLQLAIRPRKPPRQRACRFPSSLSSVRTPCAPALSRA
jgi:hypothetical protein